MNRIEQLRKSLNISMAQAAKDLNIPYTTYVNYEKGTREPNSEMLIALANYFNVTIDYLLERSFMDITTIEAHSEDEKQILNNYRTLDDIDKAEIRGEIKQMLKADKYHNNISDDIINELKQIATAPMSDTIKQK